MLPTLDILIVNWNAGPQLRACLTSIAQATQTHYHLLNVIVIDNASTDDSAQHLSFPLPLSVIHNPNNAGFGIACNLGAAQTQGDYLLILNPDIRLYPDTLDKLLPFSQTPRMAHTGIFSIQLFDQEGHIQRSCARFPSLKLLLPQMLGLDHLFPQRFPPHFMLEWDHQDSRPVDQVPGGFCLIRRTTFEQIQGFDPRFFLYYEDVDLAFRAAQAGWQSMYFAEAQAYHAGQGTTNQIRAHRLFYFLQSRLLYVYKHFDRRSATLILFATLFLEPWPRLLIAFRRRTFQGVQETLRGYLRLWQKLPQTFAIMLKHSSPS